MSEKIRVAVVDDHPLMLEGIAHVLSQWDDIEIVGKGGSADAAIEVARQVLPDVILLDLNMPGTGFAAISHIAKTCPTVRIIVLTMGEDHDAVGKALDLGASAYVLKGLSSTDLHGIIRTVHDGGTYVSASLAEKAIEGLGRGRQA